MVKNSWHLYTDGGARGNPGPAGIGFFIKDSFGTSVDKGNKYIGRTTNNIAEYMALLTGLKRSIELGLTRLICFSDSELMVRQLTGRYKVKDTFLKNFYSQVINLKNRFEELKFVSIPRERNYEADRLVNDAIDKALRNNLV